MIGMRWRRYRVTPTAAVDGSDVVDSFPTLRPRAGREADMAEYTVVKVRKERAGDGSHRHIEGVITSEGAHYTRREVVRSIRRGSNWQTSAGGHYETIRQLPYCIASNCLAAPYIATNPTSTGLDNLENLPEG